MSYQGPPYQSSKPIYEADYESDHNFNAEGLTDDMNFMGSLEHKSKIKQTASRLTIQASAELSTDFVLKILSIQQRQK